MSQMNTRIFQSTKKPFHVHCAIMFQVNCWSSCITDGGWSDEKGLEADELE